MSPRSLILRRIDRRIKGTGETERLELRPGVNLISGPPNSGKSVWMRMLDFTLGDDKPFRRRFNTEILHKYDRVDAFATAGQDEYSICRSWEPHTEGERRIQLAERSLGAKRFQEVLMRSLGIPLVTILRGEDFSPHLISLRVLMRHFFRQQRFWSDIADEQYADEVRASILVLVGATDLLAIAEQREVKELRQAMASSALRARSLEDVLHAFSDSYFAAAASEFKGAITARRVRDELEVESQNLRDTGRELVSQFAREKLDTILDLAFKRGKLIEQIRVLKVYESLWAQLEALEEAKRDASIRLSRIRDRLISNEDTGYARGQLNKLAHGMNEYLTEINNAEPGMWKHKHPIEVEDRPERIVFRVGPMEWSKALGGTDSLFFLLSYHYAMLKMSADPDANCPGFAMIDLPADFSGEPVREKENLVIMPFMQLLKDRRYGHCQLIIAGRGFDEATNCNNIKLTETYLA